MVCKGCHILLKTLTVSNVADVALSIVGLGSGFASRPFKPQRSRFLVLSRFAGPDPRQRSTSDLEVVRMIMVVSDGTSHPTCLVSGRRDIPQITAPTQAREHFLAQKNQAPQMRHRCCPNLRLYITLQFVCFGEGRCTADSTSTRPAGSPRSSSTV
jgi:hypothetical protein